MFPKKYIFTTLFIFAVLLCGKQAFAATEFVSTIKQSGGDFSALATWEAAIQCDLTASTTVVYSGSGTGALAAASTVELFRGETYQNITARVIATTSTQILVQSFSGAYKVLQSGDQWRKASSTANMFAVAGTGGQLGDSAIAIAKIDGAWTAADTAAVSINGWTTSATNYIKVYTTESARHNGKWDDTKHRISITGIGISISEDYVSVDGVQIRINGTAYSYIGIYIGTEEIKISNNIIKKVGAAGSNNYGIFSYYHNSGTVKIWNNIIYDFIGASDNTGGGIVVVTQWPYTSNWYVYNNTVYNCYFGFRFVENLKIFKNNIAQNCTDGFYGSFTATSDYNISDIPGDAPGAHSKNSTNVAFISEANDDFHIAHSDTNAKDAGANLSADSYLSFADDIDGEVRVGAWDIGADESFGSAQINSPQTNLMADDGLVGYWSFNGQDMNWASTTAEALDRSGNSNNGNVINGAKPVSGISGQAMQFDGVDDYISSNFQFSIFNFQSISNWINFQTLATDKPIIGKWGNSQNAILLKIDDTNNDELKICVASSLTDDCINAASTTDANLAVKNWHNLQVVYDGTQSTNADKLKLYLNGSQKTLSFIGTIPAVLQNSSANLEIGGDSDLSDYTNCLIDEARIYNRALSVEEIGELYWAGARKMQVNAPQTNLMADDGLVGYWSFNGADMNWASTTAEALDRSGNSNNGNVVNGAKPVSGISGQAMQFDGVDDYVNPGTVISNATAYSVSLWIKSNGTSGTSRDIAAASTNNPGHLWRLRHYATTDKFLYSWTDGASIDRSLSSDDTVTEGVWYHIVITNSGNAQYIYINGARQTSSLAYSGINRSVFDINIGTYAKTALNTEFNGFIDEPRIYNRALSADEIGALYRAGARKARY